MTDNRKLAERLKELADQVWCSSTSEMRAKILKIADELDAAGSERDAVLREALNIISVHSNGPAMLDALERALKNADPQVEAGLHTSAPSGMRGEAQKPAELATVVVPREPCAWRHSTPNGWVVTKTKHMDSEPLYAESTLRLVSGRDIHSAWRDGMLAQGRSVTQERMKWETLSQQDRDLDDGIAAMLAAAQGEGKP